MAITVRLRAIDNAGPRQAEFAAHACALIEQAVNDPRFEPAILAASYTETRFADADGTWRSVPVDMLAAFVRQGLERGTDPDGVIDIAVTLRRFRRGVLGSTRLGALPFSTAYWFINDCIKHDEPAELAGHFIHEWLHVCGFYHWPDNGARDDVAYNIGNIVRRLARGDAKATSTMPDWLNAAHCGAAGPDPARAEPEPGPLPEDGAL